MRTEQTPMFEELPTDNPDGSKKKRSPNILQEILSELMNSRGVEMADIHKATGVPYPTLCDWCFGNVQTQKLDRNILKLAQFFNVSIEYLVYGIGSDTDPFERFSQGEENEKPE